MICTIATLPYLGLALTMGSSFIEHHPQGKVYVLLVGEGAASLPVLPATFEVVCAAELGIEDYTGMESRYTAFELCNALKPFWLEYLLLHYGVSKISYFDADICFFGSIEPVLWKMLDTASIVLTPHFCRLPEDNSDIFQEIAVLRRGVYNGGFIGISNTPDGHAFLKWWKARLGRFGYHRLSESMNCDQLWLDFAPSFGLNVRILNDPGYNVAYWNLHERHLTTQRPNPAPLKFLVNNHPLVFFHFSGYSPDHPDRITTHWTGHSFSKFPELKPLFDAYQRRLKSLPFDWPQTQSRKPPVRFEPHRPDRPASQPSANRVSVIVTVQNGAGSIQKAIESVLAQTYPDLEIIVVDAGSTDATQVRLEPYIAQIRSFRQPQCRTSAARTLGLSVATGEFIAFLDAEDSMLRSTRLADQVQVLRRHTDFCLVNSGWELVNQHQRVLCTVQPWKIAPESDLKHYLLRYPARPAAMLFRRSWLDGVGGFDTRLEFTDVEDLIARLAVAGGLGGWVTQVTTRIGQYETSIPGGVYEHASELEQVLNRLFLDPNLPTELRQNEHRIRFEILMNLSLRYFDLRHRTAFLKYLDLANTAWPASWPVRITRLAGRLIHFYWMKSQAGQ
ncbi:MAG TPA: glycosyltransferase family A protein [Acidobacteriota bacterium]|nr:glycosyltransferase family A protein [Acidobacteriota bacterium]